MGDDREEIARIIDPDAFRDVEEAYNWALRHTRRAGDWWFAPACESRLVRIQDAYAKADAILARAQGPCTPVAQSVELAAHNGLVPGSSPGGSTEARAQGPAPGEADHIPDVGKKIIPALGEAVALLDDAEADLATLISKFGYFDNGEPKDWSEWQSARDTLARIRAATPREA